MDPPSCLQLSRLISNKRFIFKMLVTKPNNSQFNCSNYINTSGEGKLIERGRRLSSDQKNSKHSIFKNN